MKIISKIILIILSVIIFILLTVSVNVRFQVLSLRFWVDGFNRNNTYIMLSDSIKKNVLTQASAKGVRTGDIGILNDLISPQNVKDLINNNITNLLEYANGNSKELIAYIPIDKIPKGMISKELSKISTEVKFSDLLNQLNVKGVPPEFILQIKHLGLWSWSLFYLLVAVYTLILVLLYKMTNYGKKYTALAISLFVSGLFVLAIGILGKFISGVLFSSYISASTIESSLVAIIAPPILSGIADIWIWFGGLVMAVGLVLFFIRKGQYNKAK